ncbi:hypothetical protein BATDEDRAFT_28250 [Batrachochytrium dendrobatidis JAM81]|uniref:Attractin/MKLN-like beta-propeller domain-containing protein n=1 Tax=Batrachochytrium dendrobatidis (strain JAM81 / FGSC 10211) TaxID=684364 RepID=F4PDG2_BATDJ|nr:uncharacterized protein BATDEDRAFT_28250 [Batrachochytrium dendrobatidis JAM81]EGF76669.1 hypothetical protein BATDEDRAFT_28250 [Batrachochytrium dendrobatidis JAM81]|eukprot:XP_006682604.1 hypothetical protein BATDEDRAFT_28250 [Batrachochytrium dendrobatidis JAM81]
MTLQTATKSTDYYPCPFSIYRSQNQLCSYWRFNSIRTVCMFYSFLFLILIAPVQSISSDSTSQTPVRYEASTFLYNNTLMVYGGADKIAKKMKLISSILSYNFNTKTWSTIKLDTVKRSSSPIASHTTHVISPTTALSLFGMTGGLPDTDGKWAPWKTRYSRHVYTMDLTGMNSKVFNTIPKIGQRGAPSTRARHASVWDASTKTVWVFGGYTKKGPVTDLWALDVESKRWTRMQDPPNIFGTQNKIGSVGSSMVFLGKDLIISGGSHGSPKSATNNFHVFDTVARTWSTPTIIGPSPSPRSLGGIAATSNKTFILFSGQGGYDIPATDSYTGEYDASQKSLRFNLLQPQPNDAESSSNEPIYPAPRDSFGMTADSSGNVIMFGGRANNRLFIDIPTVSIFSGTRWIPVSTFTPGQPALPTHPTDTLTVEPPSNFTVILTSPNNNQTNTKTPNTQPPQQSKGSLAPDMVAIIIAICACIIAIVSVFISLYTVLVLEPVRPRLAKPQLATAYCQTNHVENEICTVTTQSPSPPPPANLSHGMMAAPLSMISPQGPVAPTRIAPPTLFKNNESAFPAPAPARALNSEYNPDRYQSITSHLDREQIIQKNIYSLRHFISSAEAAAHTAGIIGELSDDECSYTAALDTCDRPNKTELGKKYVELDTRLKRSSAVTFGAYHPTEASFSEASPSIQESNLASERLSSIGIQPPNKLAIQIPQEHVHRTQLTSKSSIVSVVPTITWTVSPTTTIQTEAAKSAANLALKDTTHARQPEDPVRTVLTDTDTADTKPTPNQQTTEHA